MAGALGAILGAISGALVTPIAAATHDLARGVPAHVALRQVRLVLVAWYAAPPGALVGCMIGLVIGCIVACMRAPSRRRIRSVVLTVTIGAGVAAALLIAQAPGNTNVGASVLAFAVVPTAFAVVLGQLGARWLIEASEQ